jgi:flavin reductase (DIM6/NTAB) family NADH-FMN oxidoreductase RutF/rubredoxin
MINYEALFNLSYGMYIVCAGNEKSGNGFISNSVFQVTAEPSQIAVCCNKENFSAELISSSKAFSISILRQEAPTKLIGTFGYKSGRDTNKLSGLEIQTGETGVPIVLNEALAIIECKLTNSIDVGTHLVFIGEVIHSKQLVVDGTPLTYAYYREVKKGIAPKNAPTYIDKTKLTSKEDKTEKKKYKCVICGHIYDPQAGDPDNGITAGTAFEDLPSDWHCPICGASKDDFIEI